MDFSVNFDVVYIGCISILKSMKETIFEDRSALTKECIARVAEGAHCITAKDRKVPHCVRDCIKSAPDLRFGGYSVELTISTTKWTVKLLHSGEIIFAHDMRNISFASAGDGRTADFIAYVAKNGENDRRCFVFDCPSAIGQEIIASMGNAFKLRFEQVNLQNRALNNGFTQPPNIEESTASESVSLLEATPITAVTPDYVGLPPTNLDLLKRELWFHGKLSREMSEQLVRCNGEFLVRQSENQPNQFILTGMQDGVHKHLLLIDEFGVVRTKDKKFNDICDLIQYHRGNNVPISSTESFLILRGPVNR